MANGGKRDGAGRPKGVGNKSTIKAREAISLFVDDNAHRLTGWLDQIAEDNPKQAFDCFQSIIEYHIPKLQRSEQRFVDEEGNDRDLSIEVDFVKGEHKDT